MTGRGVLVIYTGGTIGMVPSPRGYEPARGIDALLRRHVPELLGPDMPAWEVLEYEQPLDSSDMNPSDWRHIAKDIAGAGEEFSGFLVLHGTDTMAYTASALSYLLLGLGRPVIVTGSQVPLGETGSDAVSNVAGAMRLLATPLSDRVWVYFGDRLFPGNRTTKIKAASFDAFSTPRMVPDADKARDCAHGEGGPLVPPRPAPARIGVVRLFPGIDGRFFEAVLSTGLQGLVVECYGVGNGPSSDARLVAVLREACDRGVVIVGVSQCLEGTVDLGMYAAGSALAEAGVVNGYDMTLEAAYTKLHYLFGLGLEPAEVARRIPVDLCGEVNAGSMAAST